MKNLPTQGLLLSRHIMANDNGVLEVFTKDAGRVTVFVTGLGKSKTKIRELDFFRLLDMNLVTGRQHYRLGQVHTCRVFSGFGASYAALEVGFSWIKRLQKMIPPERVWPEVYHLTCDTFTALTPESAPLLDTLFRYRLLQLSGWMPDWQTQESFSVHREGATVRLHPTNAQRRWCGFLTRADIPGILKHAPDMQADMPGLQTILHALEAEHGLAEHAYASPS